MTYKARLEQLLALSIQKSNAYIDIVSREGQSNSEQYLKARTESEAAESAYISFLLSLEACGASIHDPLPQNFWFPSNLIMQMHGN